MESIDTMIDKTNSPIAFFRLKSLETSSRKSIDNMGRAIDSLARFVGGADFSFNSFDRQFLSEWAARQFFEGYYSKTIAYNLSKIAALYNKAVDDGVASSIDVFSLIISKINDAPAHFNGINHSHTFQQIRLLFKSDYSTNPNRQLAKDVILFGILNGGMTLSQIGYFKKDDYTGDDENIIEIIKRYSKPKKKYLFPLHQAHSTPKQLLSTLGSLVGLVLKSHSIEFKHQLNSILVNLWSDIAMNCGISSYEIAACISHTGESNALTFCAEQVHIAPDRISEIRKLVSKTVTNNPVHWYAMHLRPHMGYQDLTNRLKDKNIILDEIFYPIEKLYHKIGKKNIFENRPIISWLVFYRTRVTQLNKLFHEIGDIAWGYRYRRDVTSPYAVISDQEIREYQYAIGSVNPSTNILSDEDVKFNAGDYLVTLGGPMNGRHGVFIAEKKEKGEVSGRVVFRIKLTGGNNFNWEVNWDPRLVKKISEEQYNRLDSQFQEKLENMKPEDEQVNFI